MRAKRGSAGFSKATQSGVGTFAQSAWLWGFSGRSDFRWPVPTSDTTTETIDEYFGWDQKQAKRKQQVRYSGSTDLLKLARVTMML